MNTRSPSPPTDRHRHRLGVEVDHLGPRIDGGHLTGGGRGASVGDGRWVRFGIGYQMEGASVGDGGVPIIVYYTIWRKGGKEALLTRPLKL